MAIIVFLSAPIQHPQQYIISCSKSIQLAFSLVAIICRDGVTQQSSVPRLVTMSRGRLFLVLNRSELIQRPRLGFLVSERVMFRIDPRRSLPATVKIVSCCQLIQRSFWIVPFTPPIWMVWREGWRQRVVSLSGFPNAVPNASLDWRMQ